VFHLAYTSTCSTPTQEGRSGAIRILRMLCNDKKDFIHYCWHQGGRQCNFSQSSHCNLRKPAELASGAPGQKTINIGRGTAGSSDASESADQVSDLIPEGCSTESTRFKIRKRDVHKLNLTYDMQIIECSARFDSLWSELVTAIVFFEMSR